MNDSGALGRFIAAQEPVLERVHAELTAGAKQSHWMWFVFPQLQGLGSSTTARRFAITSLEEARAYLAHSLLGPRLIECTRLVNAVEGRTAEAIFGHPDHLKFRSCMTLFAHAAGNTEPGHVFRTALDQYFAGAGDPLTLGLLSSSACGT